MQNGVSNKSQPYGRIGKYAHTSQPWRIHEIAWDFTLEDVWAVPASGGVDDFPLFISTLKDNGSVEEGASLIGRFLFALRWKLGEWFDWDKTIIGANDWSHSLRDRLPFELFHTHPIHNKHIPFTPLYMTNDEYAAEIINATVHGIIHLSWVKDGERGGFRGQMAVLVKPHGFLGKVYMGVIKPFRYLFIYPAFMNRLEQNWRRAKRNIEPTSMSS